MSTPPPAISGDLAFALTLAEIADGISLPRFRAADLRVEAKPDRSFVTDADHAVEQALRRHIESHRPDDGFLGEETGRHDKGRRRWIIDPIDGTSNFLRGVSNWATLIALEVDDVPVLGVISAPAVEGRWWAENGAGAWGRTGGEEPHPLRVSGVSRLEHASLSFQSIEQWEQSGHLRSLLTLSRSVWQDRAYGDMWSYVLLVEGQLDIVAEFGLESYDLAALAPIVREAGGRFTDVADSPTTEDGSVVATNGLLHSAVISTIRDAR
ncbi:inositol monophosphatase family protein [Microbacterium sp. NPDC089698]|uniref:inositol monophosphatase family protein n=1 Tax=Microbacterium sp. NPDC089698 TaxID=3364200 RepID=UPI00380AF601